MISLNITLLFWDNLNDQPDSIKIFDLVIPSSKTSIYHPAGAGLKVDNYIIYSTSYPLLSDLYFLFISLLFVFTYFRLEPLFNTKEIEKSLKLWKTISILLLVYSIIRLPWFKVTSEMSSIFLVPALFLIMYIALSIPMGLLITDTQITRIYDLILELDKMSKNNAKEYLGNEDLLEYLLTVNDKVSKFYK